jgi:hypothetical protein
VLIAAGICTLQGSSGMRTPAVRGVSSTCSIRKPKTPHISSPEKRVTNSRRRSVESGSVSSDNAADRLHRSALEVVRFWESNVFFGILANLVTTHGRVLKDGSSDDLDRVLGGAMTTGHLHVHLRDSSAKGRVSVLLVHVNGTSAGQVTEDNAVVPDAGGLSLEDLARGDDLALDLADLVLSLHVVPELGSGEDSVSVEHSHAVELGLGVLLCGQSTTHNVKLSQLRQQTKSLSIRSARGGD